MFKIEYCNPINLKECISLFHNLVNVYGFIRHFSTDINYHIIIYPDKSTLDKPIDDYFGSYHVYDDLFIETHEHGREKFYGDEFIYDKNIQD